MKEDKIYTVLVNFEGLYEDFDMKFNTQLFVDTNDILQIITENVKRNIRIMWEYIKELWSSESTCFISVTISSHSTVIGNCATIKKMLDEFDYIDYYDEETKTLDSSKFQLDVFDNIDIICSKIVKDIINIPFDNDNDENNNE